MSSVEFANQQHVRRMCQDALSLDGAMRNEGMVVSNALRFVYFLQAYAKTGIRSYCRKGKPLHSDITKRGLQSDVAGCGSLVNMYSKCGSLRDATTVFDGISGKKVVT